MSNCAKLPPALLDLVLSRAFASSTVSLKSYAYRTAFAATARRHSHAVAYQNASSPAQYIPPSPSPYMNAQLPDFVKDAFPDMAATPQQQMTELEKRVQELTNIEVSEDTAPNDSAYSEDELLMVYEDLLALSPPPSQKADPLPVEDDAFILNAVAERLISPDGNRPFANSFRDQLSRLHQSDFALSSPSTLSLPRETNTDVGERHTHSSYRDILHRLQGFVTGLETVRPSTSTGGESSEQILPISPSIMTEKEWSALARVCALNHDTEAVYDVFDLMKRSASLITEGTFNSVLAIFAEKGDIQTTEGLLQRHLTEVPTERQRDLHVKSYLKASVATESPDRALAILHDYEARGLPAPQRTYTRCITHLFSARSSVAHAHAWDLFSHMRYAAHPVPDGLLYTLMIRACATSSFSAGVEPERALDLFHEMTVDQGIQATSGAYAAAILACACSGEKSYVHEAFRLAKQMLDAYRDARGYSAFAPDARLFKALLQGAKRIRDLGRTRWLLAEMVRVAGEMERKEAGSSVSLQVDEEMMMHVFNAYAAYNPPFRRSETKIVDTPIDTVSQASDRSETTSSPSHLEHQTNLTNPPKQPAFTHLPPQTHAELITEVRLLMDQIVEHNTNDGGEKSTSRFKHVRLTPRLINAYLAVHYAHSPLDTWIGLYRGIFTDLGIPKNARTYVEVLERCAKTRKGERKVVMPLGDEIWTEWESVEDSWQKDDPHSLPMNARTVERVHTAMIRLLSITGQLDRALDHVKGFVARYPFSAVRTPAPQDQSRSTRTVLTGARPLVRLTSAVDIPDDTVPPLLTFPELEILHHKFVAAKKVDGIRYLKWVCKSYEGALKMRRDRTLQAREVGTETD